VDASPGPLRSGTLATKVGRPNAGREDCSHAQVREVLRLRFVGDVPTREIARRLGVAPSMVRETLKHFAAACLIWPLPEEVIDAFGASRRSNMPHCGDAYSVNALCDFSPPAR
jgi:hypothetical protein